MIAKLKLIFVHLEESFWREVFAQGSYVYLSLIHI